MDLVPALNDGGIEGAEACALHDPADADKGEDEGHEGKVGQLDGPAVCFRVAFILMAPLLPVFPRSVGAGVGGPASTVVVPVVGCRRGGGAVVARPAMAPGVVCLALLDVGEDVMGSDQHAVALQADVQRQIGYGRRGMAPVGVVQLDEGIEALLGIRLAPGAFQNLIRRGCDNLRPPQQLWVMMRVGVVRIRATRCRMLRECMTA